MAGRLRPKTGLLPRSGTAAHDDDCESFASFRSSPSPPKGNTRMPTWTGSPQVGCEVDDQVLLLLLAVRAGTNGCFACRLAWSPATRARTWHRARACGCFACARVQVDHDAWHKMLEECRAAKQKQAGDELKIRQCVLTRCPGMHDCWPMLRASSHI